MNLKFLPEWKIIDNDFKNLILSPLIWAAGGSDNTLDKYQPVAAFAASLNKLAAVLATFTQAEPFQNSTAKVACTVPLSFL